MDAITYKNLLLILGDTMLPVINIVIHEEPGKHGILDVIAAAQVEAKDYLLYEENGGAALYAVLDKNIQPLFHGVVIRMEVNTRGSYSEIFIRAVTASYQLDLIAQNRTFQDVEMTSHQLIRKVLESYPYSQVLFSIPDAPLGHIAVQYQETDWAFLNRILSSYGTHACIDSTTPGICLRAGLMDTEEDADWDSLPYTLLRDTAPKNAQKPLRGQLCYIVEAYDILPVGEKVRFKGQELYIGKTERYIRQGLFISKYYLFFREGLTVLKYHNPYLGGVSINGIVTNVKRNRLQVRLETDALSKHKKKYFFPFSSVAASSDGSGWYCMPIAGDRVRIFFPTEDEGDGYAIANIQGNSTPAQNSSMGNPDIKDIAMPDGKSVRFLQGGIQLSVGDEKGTVTLTNDGNAEIKTDGDITISSADMIYFTTDGTMTVEAGTQIQITNESGGSITMTEDTIELDATNIYNNCEGMP